MHPYWSIPNFPYLLVPQEAYCPLFYYNVCSQLWLNQSPRYINNFGKTIFKAQLGANIYTFYYIIMSG